ncbi:hypothetical protein LX36DRAFT_400343 [Colletotrichum falcatum]|nr:hypothetical protein LX36DRAFT_400343 [Colletotrichum falcatum]
MAVPAKTAYTQPRHRERQERDGATKMDRVAVKPSGLLPLKFAPMFVCRGCKWETPSQPGSVIRPNTKAAGVGAVAVGLRQHGLGQLDQLCGAEIGSCRDARAICSQRAREPQPEVPRLFRAKTIGQSTRLSFRLFFEIPYSTRAVTGAFSGAQVIVRPRGSGMTTFCT